MVDFGYNSDNGDVNDDNVGLVMVIIMMIVVLMMMAVGWVVVDKEGKLEDKGRVASSTTTTVESGAHLRLTKKERVAHNRHASNWNRSLSSKLLNWDKSHSSVHNKHTTRQHFADRHGHKNICQKHQI